MADHKKRPYSVTVISYALIAAAATALAYHLGELRHRPFQYDMVMICFIQLTAIVCGVFMLRGKNWARWLTVVWIALYVVISAFHSHYALVFHAFLFAVLVYLLFRREANEHFQQAKALAA